MEGHQGVGDSDLLATVDAVKSSPPVDFSLMLSLIVLTIHSHLATMATWMTLNRWKAHWVLEPTKLDFTITYSSECEDLRAHVLTRCSKDIPLVQDDASEYS